MARTKSICFYCLLTILRIFSCNVLDKKFLFVFQQKKVATKSYAKEGEIENHQQLLCYTEISKMFRIEKPNSSHCVADIQFRV